MNKFSFFLSLLLVELLSFNFHLWAQTGPVDPASQFKVKIFPPSPEASNFGRYGEYPVSLNNGLINISIPLYEIKSGKLALPINLSYHAGGVKAYDVASSVGLGWTLNAGGAITRTIMGAPDESGRGVLSNPFPLPNGPGEHFPCFLGGLVDQISPLDGQSDIFNYNLIGSSGKFLFKNIMASGTPFEIATIPYSPLKIDVSSDFRTFTVIDLDGTTYIFSQVEYTSVVGEYSNVPSAWYLRSIISADKSSTITFTYTQPVPITSAQGSNSISERVDAATNVAGRTNFSHSITMSEHLSFNIQEITFDNGKVTFEYATDRLDSNGKRLTAVRIFQKKTGQYNEIKKFMFAQSYFMATGPQNSQVSGWGSNDVKTKRLKLDSFYEQGILDGVIQTKPSHTFEYETEAFPIYGSTAQDFMGFYNGAHGNENLLFYGLGNVNGISTLSQQFGADRTVNPNFIKAGVLKKINFPTGGYTIFESEPNQINYTKTVVQPTYNSYSYLLSSRASIFEQTFTVTPAMTGNQGSVIGDFEIDLVNNIVGQPLISTGVSIFDVTTNSYADLYNPNIFPSAGQALYSIPSTASLLTERLQVILLSGHTYRFSYSNSFQATNNFLYTNVHWQIQTGSTTSYINTTEYTGGLRIKSITSNDGQGNTLKKKYAYTKWYYNSNLFNGNIASLANSFKGRSKRYFNPNPSAPFTGERYWYNNYGENITFQLGSSSNMVASYEEVEEYAVDGQDNPLGKTVSTYNKAIDNIPSLAPSFRSDEEWKRSQLANQKFFKSNASGQFVLVKEVTNTYDYNTMGSIKNYWAFLSEDNVTGVNLAETFKECSMIYKINVMSWMDFDQAIYKSNLISSTTVEFDENGLNPHTSVIQYVYDNIKHQQLVKTIQNTSENENRKLVTNLKYPLDYTIGTCDQQVCYSNYNTQFNPLLAIKNSCEVQYYDQYNSYVVAAAAILVPIYQIYNDCSNGCGGSIACLGNCFDDRANNVAASQYDETIALANTAFNSYLGCTGTYQAGVASAVSQLNSCKTTYANCVSTLLGGASATRDKSILIMQRDNVINRVIENTNGFTLSGTEYVTNGERTDFKPFANGTTGPDLIWGFNSSTPVAKASFDVNSTPYYRKIGTFTKYNSSNNVVQQAKESDINTSFLWDYNNEYPVAEVVNAGVDDIAYTSFEAEGLGNFTAITGTQRNTVDYRTGKQSYSLSNGAISKSGLVLSTKYTISMWAKTGASISINGGSALVPTSSLVNGWQYYQTVITNSATATISGTAVIDDLRLYPIGAQMKTYTYEPLVGVTSQTDANNQTTYFAYDALGRVLTVKDDNGNIVKSYQYNYRR